MKVLTIPNHARYSVLFDTDTVEMTTVESTASIIDYSWLITADCTVKFDGKMYEAAAGSIAILAYGAQDLGIAKQLFILPPSDLTKFIFDKEAKYEKRRNQQSNPSEGSAIACCPDGY